MKIKDILQLPNIEIGDEILVGKFRNRKATVKGFKKDAHNPPVLKTTKEDENKEIEVDVHGDATKGYVLSKIVVPVKLRGRGVGSKVMKDLIDKADNEHAIIALTPDTAFGGTKGRLIKFYKGFGFVPNKGRNKDFRYRETMIRYPKDEKV